ncbi:MarC family protein, partial [Staphylococcus haemolyticus]|uniref:MarC family protein n=1 Tax=Staphylococcus haemolyticus TaxID=1283 RepID=UPI0034D73160
MTASAWPRLSDSKPAADPKDLTKSFFSLLALINPIGAIPFFISLTESQTDEEKRRTIKVASISVAIVIGLSALLG